ncbi:UxaA family hydrolase [Runella slithyformis]|uniref:Altronate dehydratase n=1 Tax=Runella slithyformis (strain ATCC 29530 / DSM 19594 / LMG 11500 / NCIMB 11436 / LSU 4) TaxID=761193 RepID=A0A7U4E991_RUNSL|nr:altronate dehydratase family protein [Runella slithyformis]AEI52239.1 Altronate dehydratase [Runella slithyformis DSM 19594]
MHTYLSVHPKDNVLVALQNLPKGTAIEYNGQSFDLIMDIPSKHKFVTEDLAAGDHVTMYGVLVGKATQPIRRGEQVTTFNLKHDSDEYSVSKRKPYPEWQAPDVSKWQGRTFMGYHRSDGQVGTANYWLVVPLVFCENRNILKLKDAFDKALGYAFPDIYLQQTQELVQLYQTQKSDGIAAYTPSFTSEKPVIKPLFPNLDGIKFLTHESGCGENNQDSALLAALFGAYANNANVAGITVLSLGCQKTQFEDLTNEIKSRNPLFDKPILFYEQQAYGTEFDMLSAAIKGTFQALIEANKLERRPAPLSKLNIGLKCGGSDGFSGISANPVLGHLSDIVVALNGRTYLAEFPELCGVEQELIDRCADEEKAEKFETLMRQYASKAEAVGAGFDMNPSAGNIKDGLITDAIKSAGAAKKGGTAPIADVLNYTEVSKVPGLHLVCTPGNDVLATTGQAAAGATITLFTTGLGTPTGNPICPMVKVATNSKLAQKMSDIIDFDCGPIIVGEKTIEQTAEELLEYCIELASGTFKTKAQLLGQDDFMPWKRGVSL